MKQDGKQLCPFKKIVERDYNGCTGKTTINERFAPCAGERCMAYVRWGGKCLRLEGGDSDSKDRR